MGYIGHSPTNAGTFYILDALTMGSGTTYTMQVGGVDVSPSADNLLITLDGVIQHAGDAYTVSGSNIVFASGPGSGVEFYGIIMGQSATVGQGSIGADELKVSGDGTNGQVLVSDGDGTFSWATDTENYLPLAGGTMSGSINLGSQNITNGGTITGTFVGNITGNVTGNTSGTAATVTGAAQSAITSVGTLTTLQVGGQNSTPKLEWFYDHSNGTDYKANISLAGNDLEVRGSNGAMEFYTGAVDGASSTLALSINSSQNATFAGNITQSKAGNLRHTMTATGDGEAALVLTANNTTGDSFVRWETNANTFCMGLDNSDSNKFILSCGSDPHSNSVINIQPDGSAITLDKVTTVNADLHVVNDATITSTARFWQVRSHTDNSKITKHGYDGLYTTGAQHQYISSAQDIKFYPGGSNTTTIASGGLLTHDGTATFTGTATFNQTAYVSAANTSTSATFGLGITNSSSTSDTIAGIIFKNYDNNAAWIRSIRTGSAEGVLLFGTNTGGGIAESNITEKMRITSGGNVGIGETNPARKLVISETESEACAVLYNSRNPSSSPPYILDLKFGYKQYIEFDYRVIIHSYNFCNFPFIAIIYI